MEAVIEYLLKFSISLTLLYCFYRLVLRPLTFYQWNRFYLLSYCLLSFIIPLIDVGPWFGEDGGAVGKLMVPSISAYTSALAVQPSTGFFTHIPWQAWVLAAVVLGSMVFLVRLVIQLISLAAIRRSAQLLRADDSVSVYRTEQRVSPFSFGRSVFLNPSMHQPQELHKIIQHEFVHVKQLHSVDLIVAELICMLNWFNPFAWLIRFAVRQNLEFIADNRVVETGVDKQEYQYLLLKVLGVEQYRIANNFNISNLKKRIAMMNKMKTAKVHLAKFLFILPVLVVSLLAFRESSAQQIAPADLTPLPSAPLAPPSPDVAPAPAAKSAKARPAAPSPDLRPADIAPPAAVPAPMAPPARDTAPKANTKGYVITVADNNGECIVIVKDRSRKIVKALLLTEWTANQKEFETQYGEVPPPPPPPRVVSFAKPKAAAKPGARHEPPVLKEIRVVDKTATSADKVAPAEKSKEVIEVRVKELPVDPSQRSKQAPVGAVNLLRASNGKTNDNILWVIDGVKQEKGKFDPNSIEPNSIESITVLKDKSAASLYGDEGKDGVIQIQTKKPKN